MPRTIFASAFVLSVAVLPMPSAAQGTSLNPATADVGNALKAAGRAVGSEISKNVFIVFQDSKGTSWFGSDGDGVYRDNGKTIVHFEQWLRNDAIPHDKSHTQRVNHLVAAVVALQRKVEPLKPCLR